MYACMYMYMYMYACMYGYCICVYSCTVLYDVRLRLHVLFEHIHVTGMNVVVRSYLYQYMSIVHVREG